MRDSLSGASSKQLPVFIFTLFIIIGTKNAKQRAECLEELGTHIRKQGVSVAGAQPPVALKEIAKQIADRDTGVRNAALNAVTEAYFKVSLL